MAQGQCDWKNCPEDLARVVSFFFQNKHRLGQGGNPDKTLLNESAVYLASFGPPASGEAKNTKSIGAKWAECRKMYDAISAVIAGTYVGASGWVYSHDLGFNVDASNRAAFANFIKAHPIFKPFANKGWAHWHTMHDTLPERARGKYVFNAAAMQPPAPPSTPAPSGAATHPNLRLPLAPSQQAVGGSSDLLAASQLLSLSQKPPGSHDKYDDGDFGVSYGDSQAYSDDSQPFSDWSQTQPGGWAPDKPVSSPPSPELGGRDFGMPQLDDMTPLPPKTTSDTPAQPVPLPNTTPASSATPARTSIKRSASHDAPVPWEPSKRVRGNGADAIRDVASSIGGMTSAVLTCFAPPKPAADMKKVARDLARADAAKGVISVETRRRLHIHFGENETSADAYATEEDEDERSELAALLLEK